MMALSSTNKGLVAERLWTAESAYQLSTTTILGRSSATPSTKSFPGSASSIPSASFELPTATFRRSARTTFSGGSNSSASAGQPTGARSETVAGPSQVSGSSTATATSKGSGISSSIIPDGPASGYNSSNHSGLSAGAEKAVIATTVIGGTLILALIVFVLWHRRKSRRDMNIARMRPPSTTTFLSAKSRDANLTALPMHRERRSKIAEAGDEPSPIPPRLQDLYKHDPSTLDVWKTANPPTPTMAQCPINEVDEFGTSQLKPPEMAQVASTSPMVRVSSHDYTSPDLAESIHAPSIIDLETGPPLYTPTSERPLQGRWSWATSYATVKSRLETRSKTSTVSNLPGIRTMKDWISFQLDARRRLNPMREGQPGPSRASSVTFLKNKATKPNLAPVATSELSKRQFRPESSLSAKKKRSGDPKEIEDVDAAFPEDGVIS